MVQESMQTADVVLIASVGRTPEPLEASLAEHTPDAAILIASEDSMGVAAQLRERYPEIRFKTLLVNQPEHLVEPFRKAREALSLAKAMEAKTIVADITGGTKPMTAGVVLALSGLGVTFSYVGGARRDPDTGRVLSGAERIRLLEDPTERFYESEWRSFKLAWNSWRFDSAASTLQRLLENGPALSPSERRFFNHLLGVTNGLAAWDRFHHAEALEYFEAHLHVALAIAEAWRHGNKLRVLTALASRLDRLRNLVKTSGKPTMELLGDLLANADRRAESGRFDDALARLYRAVELAAEADLYGRMGIVLRDPATWPDRIDEALKARASQVMGLKSTLDLAFDVDLQMGNRDTLAQNLRADYDRMLPLLEKRHRSILAHGTSPVSEADYSAFRALFEKYGLLQATPWPRW